MDRRRFLHLLGIFSGTALSSSCGSEDGQKKLISYLIPPADGVTPGEALWYAATCTECPAGCGLQARVRQGWPVKVEGIPGHPVSGGGLCMRGQASLYRLYHPQRLRTPLIRDEQGGWQPIGWDEAFTRIATALAEAGDGRRHVWLSGRSTGTLPALTDDACRRLGIERLPEFEFYAHAALRQAYGRLFGIADLPRFHFAEADFLLTVGADLLETFVSPVDFARQFAQASARDDFRWLHLEPHVSLTGQSAQRRLTVVAGSEALLLVYLLRRLAAAGELRRPLPQAVLATLPDISATEAARRTGLAEDELTELAEGLAAARRPALIAGGVAVAHGDGPAVALLTALLQWAMGMAGETLDFSRAENYRSVGSLLDLAQLATALAEERIGVLLVARTNPLYQAPESLGLAAALPKARLRVALADLPDETTEAMDLLLPLPHSLESWGDAEPRLGVRTLIRPAVQPLYDSRSEGDILLGLLRAARQQVEVADYREYLFARWSERYDSGALGDFATSGYLLETPPALQPQLDAAAAIAFLRAWRPAPPLTAPLLVIAPSIRRFDGRSRLPLLEELPDPLTTISYGRWLSVSPQQEEPRLRDGDGVRLTAGTLLAELAVKVQPGMPPQVAAVQRDLLDGAPFAIEGQSGEAILLLPAMALARLRQAPPVAILAGSTSQHGRGLIPDPLPHRQDPHASLYPPHEYAEYRWGMTIDLALCTGCGACAAACYVENNVPVTPMADHLRGRELSWLRIEPYYDQTGRAAFLPMLCQHCRLAPCEPVCPVYAAYHNPEGLNIQVYERCVGTRYCANNCPYKVRRFNWWRYRRPAPLQRMLNPDLSARTRGMMEKCTFCIQRIRAARDLAKDEGRLIADGEVTTACAQSCPTGAIVFGNLLDPQARVSRLAGSERGYRVFDELGTEPAITYLGRAAVRPLAKADEVESDGGEG
jgi:Fe-S-cluster-containing dehydrogenase component